MRIVIVEDSGIQAKSLIKLLAEMGYSEVSAYPSADTASKGIVSGECDLILCDWQMPGKSGLDFLREIRAKEEFKAIPFVFLTANSDKSHVIEALKAGAHDYILKPPTRNLIEEKIVGLKKRGILKG